MSIAKPKNHTNSLAALADSSFHYGKELFVSKSWPSFVNFGKSNVAFHWVVAFKRKRFNKWLGCSFRDRQPSTCIIIVELNK